MLLFTLNGHAVEIVVSPTTLLVDMLRDTCHLKGTHIGCDTAQCGACTVLIEGRAIKACNITAGQCQGKRIDTIEGLANDARSLHAMQQAFSQHHALQCGFCTPGFVMRAMAMVDEAVAAEESSVRSALSGNLCRCTGYEGIVKAVIEGLKTVRAMRQDSRT